MRWNFVARTADEIAQARADWKEQRRFGEVKAYAGLRLSAPTVTRCARVRILSARSRCLHTVPTACFGEIERGIRGPHERLDVDVLAICRVEGGDPDGHRRRGMAVPGALGDTSHKPFC